MNSGYILAGTEADEKLIHLVNERKDHSNQLCNPNNTKAFCSSPKASCFTSKLSLAFYLAA